MRVEPEEAVLTHHLARRRHALHRDVVEIAGPVHRGARVRLGDDEPLRVECPGAHLRRQCRKRLGSLPVMAQYAETRARNGM